MEISALSLRVNRVSDVTPCIVNNKLETNNGEVIPKLYLYAA